MNAGSIANPDTAAGRLYRVLLDQEGRWLDAAWLAEQVETTCISTRISEVRKQVEPRAQVEHETFLWCDDTDVRVKQRYRLVSKDYEMMMRSHANAADLFGQQCRTPEWQSSKRVYLARESNGWYRLFSQKPKTVKKRYGKHAGTYFDGEGKLGIGYGTELDWLIPRTAWLKPGEGPVEIDAPWVDDEEAEDLREELAELAGVGAQGSLW